MANRSRSIFFTAVALAASASLAGCSGAGGTSSGLGSVLGGGTTSIGSSIPPVSQAVQPAQSVQAAPAQPAAPQQDAARSDNAHSEAVGVQTANKPAPQATASNPYPVAKGDTFAYAYAAQTGVRFGSNPETISRTAGTVTATILGSAVFNGAPHIDERSVFVYTFSDDNGKTTGAGKKTTDAYKSFDAAGSGLAYDLYGSVERGASKDSTGVTTTTTETVTYAEPFIIDQLPETAGASWSDAAGSTLDSEAIATSGSSTDKTVTTSRRIADGAYSRMVDYHDAGTNYSVTKKQSSDGSGQDQNGGSGKEAGLTVFGTPVRSGSGYVIPVTDTPPGEKSVTTNVPDWYPGNGPVGPLLVAITKDLGLSVNVPAKCGIAAGQPATRLQANRAELDVVDGTVTTHSTDRYVIPGMGVVCTVHESLVKTYDNRATGALVRTERTTEVSGLTSESGPDIKGR
jgi:hypothetical protein